MKLRWCKSSRLLQSIGFSCLFLKSYHDELIANFIPWFDLSINPFHATSPFFYPLKISENLSLSVFRGYRKRPATWNNLVTIIVWFSKKKCLFCLVKLLFMKNMNCSLSWNFILQTSPKKSYKKKLGKKYWRFCKVSNTIWYTIAKCN